MLKDSNVMEDSLSVRCLLKSPVEKVYSAWTDPAKLARWMGPGDVQCGEVTVDLKVGGKFLIEMKEKDGVHVAVGEYREIVPQKKLVFSWGWKSGTVTDSLVTLTFETQGDDTLLNLTHELLPSKTSVEHHHMGWKGCLAKLEGFTTTS